MTDDGVVEFRLYVAGDLPNSRRAIANLEAFCRRRLPDRHRIEVLDVFERPEQALADRVLLTPQLVIVSGQGRETLVGDLADGAILSRMSGMTDERP